LWSGVSEIFVDAFFSLRGKIKLSPTIPLIYMMDGKFLRLPVAANPRKKAYKKPHWMPVTMSPKTEEEVAEYE